MPAPTRVHALVRPNSLPGLPRVEPALLGRIGSTVSSAVMSSGGRPGTTYRNPVFDGSLPDPMVLRVGTEYYGSSSRPLCGAAPLAARAETELLATGARPRRISLTGVASLTPSERRVAQMAAEGPTNRDIAQALFVTPRTVQVHLTSIYRKLEITSRAQLAAALTEPARA